MGNKGKPSFEEILRSFTRTYEIVQLVNLSDGTFTTVKMSNKVKGYGTEFDLYSDALDFMIKEVVYEPDRDMMYRETDLKEMRNKLDVNPSFTIHFRVSINDTVLWNEMTVQSVNDNQAAIGFSSRNMEILLTHLHEKMDEAYYTLFAIDLDTELITVLKKAPWYDIGDVGKSVSLPEALDTYLQKIPTVARNFFAQYTDIKRLKQMFVIEDKISFTYLSTILNRWVNATLYVLFRHDDGTPATLSFGFSFVDSVESERQKLQEINKENMEIIGGITGEYLAVYYINLKERTFKVYSVDEDRLSDTKQLLTEDDNPFNLLKKFAESPAVHPDDRALLANFTIEGIKELLRGRKKVSIRFRRNYGEGYLWSVMDICKYEKAEEEANVIAVAFSERDAEIRRETDQKQLLQDALVMAQSANKAKTTFLNNMSHDIRTPMNAILGYTALSLQNIDDKERVKGYLEKMQEAGSHLLELINDVLDMSRIESGKMDIEDRENDLEEIMKSLQDIIQTDVNAKKIKFSVDMAGVDDMFILCDRLRLNQVLLNVLSNAVKYTPEKGTVTIQVRETAGKRGFGSYSFRIKDNGVGMSAEFVKSLFDPFTRAESSTISGIQGTGLGMSITKKIVDMMGGTIDVESEEGMGTTVTMNFNFKLQYRQVPGAGPAAKPARKKTAGKKTRASFPGKRILLVEDNAFNREITTEILNGFGLKVDPVEDGSVAVERMKLAIPGDYNLVFMDVQMPRMDGFEATNKIRKLENDVSEIPIIAMTANAFDEDRKKALEAGMNDHIAKPIDLDALEKLLLEYLK